MKLVFNMLGVGGKIITHGALCKHPAGDWLQEDDECFSHLCVAAGLTPSDVGSIEVSEDTEDT